MFCFRCGATWGPTITTLCTGFFVFTLAYLGYVLVNNAPIFGTQSYLEFTPGYIVHKNGLFRPKQVFAAENIAALELKAFQLRVRQKDGEIYALNLREVKGKMRKRASASRCGSLPASMTCPCRKPAAPAV